MDSRRWVGTIAALGVVVVGSAAWHPITIYNPSESPVHRMLILLLVVGSGLGLLYGAYWHHANGLDRGRRLYVLAWTFGGCGLFVAVGLLSLHVGSRRVATPELLESIHLSASIGLAAGLLVGTVHVRAIASVEAATRAEARAEALEAEREQVERLNDLLRHYVLNGVNVITGYVGELRRTVPEDEQAGLDAIEESAETMATLVRHVRGLPTAREEPPATTIDLSESVASATDEALSDTAISVEADADSPPVRASGTFDRGFVLLLDAIESVTACGGCLVIDSRSEGDRVVLSVTAEPAELSRSTEESLFEPVGSGVGLEFYLASEFVESHGDLRLADARGERLRFELVLDRAR